MEDKQNYIIAYQERESKRIQIFLYSLLFANCYGLSQLYDKDLLWAKLFFMYGLLAALIAFYFWYIQDIITTTLFVLKRKMCELSDEDIDKNKDKINALSKLEKRIHWLILILIVSSVSLGLFATSIALNIFAWFIILSIIIALFIIIGAHRYISSCILK